MSCSIGVPVGGGAEDLLLLDGVLDLLLLFLDDMIFVELVIFLASVVTVYWEMDLITTISWIGCGLRYRMQCKLMVVAIACLFVSDLR